MEGHPPLPVEPAPHRASKTTAIRSPIIIPPEADVGDEREVDRQETWDEIGQIRNPTSSLVSRDQGRKRLGSGIDGARSSELDETIVEKVRRAFKRREGAGQQLWFEVGELRDIRGCSIVVHRDRLR